MAITMALSVLNSLTVLLKKSGQRIKFTKNSDKYLVSCKSTIEEVSFDWSDHRISSTDSKVRTH